MPRKLRVFLCHASQDKPAVRELYNALNFEGWVDPWLDKAKILPGQDWEMVIEKAVDDSDVVLVCLSGQSISKEGYVQREIRYAYDLALEKPDETIFLIPLRLDDCNVPRKLKSLHWVDYFGAEKENAYSDLLRALKLRHEQKLELEVEEKAVLKQAEINSIERELRNKWEQEQKEKVARENAELSAQANLEREAAQNKLIEFREKEERESKAKAAREKSEREKKERETAEKLAREKFAREKVQREKQQAVWVEAPISQRAAPAVSEMNYRNARILGIGFVVLVVFLVIAFGGNYILKNILFAPTETPISTKNLISTPISAPMTMISERDGMTLVYVPAGDFTMGGDISSDEQPIRQVYLDAFWIDQTEVTTAMYVKCVKDKKCRVSSSISRFLDDQYANQYADHPIVNVPWNEANTYCLWARRNLPTEAQWEKAARGTDGRKFPWGEEISCDYANYYECGVGDTTEVGSYSDGASIYGALDMAGNIMEWVNDWYSETYYQSSPLSNPPGPSSGLYRVVRGGSWSLNNIFVRSANRFSEDPANSSNYIGFRCALSQP